MPFEFLKLPFTAMLAYLLSSEVPSIWTWLGGAIIFAATGLRAAATTGAKALRAPRARRG